MSVSFRFQSESSSDQTDPFPAVDSLGEKDLGAQNCMNLRSVRDLEHLKIRTVEHRLQQLALRLLCKKFTKCKMKNESETFSDTHSTAQTRPDKRFFTKIGFDTAKIESSKVWSMKIV